MSWSGIEDSTLGGLGGTSWSGIEDSISLSSSDEDMECTEDLGGGAGASVLLSLTVLSSIFPSFTLFFGAKKLVIVFFSFLPLLASTCGCSAFLLTGPSPLLK